jgi:cellulose synthase operon protein YhjQ
VTVICIGSPKGGVGKTTTSAHLAYGLRRSGYRVIAIDFDSQNALRLHFGIPLNDRRGFVESASYSEDWSSLAIPIADNLSVLPYGHPSRQLKQGFEADLMKPDFLRQRLASLQKTPGTIVIIDLPPGESNALESATNLADLRLTVLLPDSASMALLPRVENNEFYPGTVPMNSRHGFVLNQVDPQRRLNSEICAFIEHRHKDSLLGLIHRDEAVTEANATQKSVFEGSPGSLAAKDFNTFVSNVMRELLSIEKPDGPTVA